MLMLLPQEGACSNLSDNIVPCGRVVVDWLFPHEPYIPFVYIRLMWMPLCTCGWASISPMDLENPHFQDHMHSLQNRLHNVNLSQTASLLLLGHNIVPVYSRLAVCDKLTL